MTPGCGETHGSGLELVLNKQTKTNKPTQHDSTEKQTNSVTANQ